METKNKNKKMPMAADIVSGANVSIGRLAIFACIVFVLVFLSGCTEKPSDIPMQKGIYDRLVDWWKPWIAPVLLALSVGVAIYALSWFFASFTEDDKLKSWVKGELVQHGFSAVILAGLLILVAATTEVSFSLPSYSTLQSANNVAVNWAAYVQASCTKPVAAGLDRPCHIRIAEDYLQILAKASQGQATSIVRYEAFLYQISSLGLGFKSLPTPAGALSVTPFGGLTPIIETLSFVFDLTMKNMLAIRAQQFTIDFIHLAFFPFFVCIGIFFRTFYFTRRLGGLLIALAAGFYLVFPFMLVFWNGVLFSFTGPWNTYLPDTKDGMDLTSRIGTNMIRTDVSFSGVNPGVSQPIQASPAYKTPIPPQYAGKYSIAYRGEACANGSIEEWEECNEMDGAIDATTGKPHVGSFTCPPKNPDGSIKQGRENDINCDWNSCTCTSKFYGGLTGDFRSDFLPNGQQTLQDNARLTANMCFDPAGVSNQQAEEAISVVRKQWYQSLLDGYGGGLSRAIASDQLLGENGTIDNAAKLLIFSLVAPFISLMVALASVKVLSPLLGGDVEIAGLTRLI